MPNPKLLFLPALLLTLAACQRRDRCSQIGCLPVGTGISFTLLDSSGNNLVFGPAARYRADSLQLIGPDGSSKPVGVSAGSGDSALYIGFFGGPPVLYLRLSAQDTDTLSLGFETYPEECCGTVYRLRSLRYNSGPVQTTTGGTVPFQK